MCYEVDLFVVYVFEVLMGIVIEMWEVMCGGVVVIVIFLLEYNWVICFMSYLIYVDFGEFFVVV